MRFQFDYPITRTYPWRLATTWIVLGSCIIFGTLVYFNTTFVGVTTYARYSPTFTEWKPPTWVDRLNPTTIGNYTIGCESGSLVTGGMYQTPNGAFTYTVRSLYDLSTRTPTSNANYNGSDLTNCKVDQMTLSANYITYEALFQATLNCTLKGNIELTATTGSIVRYSASEVNNRVTPGAGNISRLINGFNGDVFNDLLFTGWAKVDSGGQAKPLTATYFTFLLDANATITWMYGSLSATGWMLKNPGPNGFRAYISPSGVETCENYIRIFAASILSDLGVVSQQNPLTSADAFRSAILPLDWSWRGPNSVLRPFTNDVLGGNMSDYNIPFDIVQPTYFNVYYLCHYVSWKSGTSLVIDVLVATASLFMVYWGTLNLLLTFWAKKESERANHCACTNCDTGCLAGKWES